MTTGVLDGRPAIVTGAGRGVGRGIALALASAGAPVAVLEMSEDTMGETCAEIDRRGGTSLPVVCDVRDREAITRAVDTAVDAFGGLRILVNNAQIVRDAVLLDLTEDDMDAMWSSGPLGALWMMQTCHPHLRDGGAIINLGSGATLHAGPPGMSGYAAVKAAIQTLSRAAAVQWGVDGIRVNTIQPLVPTPAYEIWQAANPDVAKQTLGNVPTGRMSDAEQDVGRVVVFLCSPDARQVTGTVVPVDGGVAYLR